MASGVQSPKSFDDEPHHLTDITPHARTSTDTKTLTLLTWNIAWGYGWGSEGQGKKLPKAHFDTSLARIAEVIRQVDADIVFIQEVDFGSTRSHGIEETEVIARAAGMPYYAEALSWDSNWVPFPYWPPSEHFGRMRSGGAILSRFPIEANHVDLLSKPANNPFWYNLFYLFRYLQRAEIQLPDRKLQVFNTHIEAFDEPNRIEHAEAAKKMIEKLATLDTILAGDFNTVPPESKLKSHYPDEEGNKTHHDTDRTLDVTRSIKGFKDVISVETFAAHQDDFFTFPAHAANRKLDYIFVGDFDVLEARVVKEAGPVSDHLPIVARVRLKNR